MKQITFKQYRTIDLSILCLLTVVFEYIITTATDQWFVLQAMAVSITLSMTCITMLRWNQYAVIIAVLGSLAYCLALNASYDKYIIYCIGSVFCLAALPIVKKLGKDRVRNDFIVRMVYATILYLFIVIGRWIVSLIFVPSLVTLIAFITTDVLSLLFAVLILFVCKGLDGVLEDQKSYLIRLDEERKQEQEENLNDPF